MRVVFVASECTPIVKVGGLGDVIGSLPKALAELGVEVTVAIPGYQTIDFSTWEKKGALVIRFAGRPLKTEIYQTKLPGSEVPVVALREEKYVGSGGIYYSKTAFASSEDEINRFSVFNLAVAKWLSQGSGGVDIVHCHDWHTGLLPHLLKDAVLPVKKVFTIHNLANQGFSPLIIDKNLGGGHLTHDKILAWDAADHNLDFMLQGIVKSDWVTTVSPSYAKEILTPVFGEGLEEVLKAREGRLAGILNGVDYEFWNPETDPLLPNHFNRSNWREARLVNKRELATKVGLSMDEKVPLFGFIGRLTDQKGIELILGALPKFISKVQVVFLGRGEEEIKNKLEQVARSYPSRVVYVNTEENFHEDYEHLMYGSCDFFLVPSRFEPCGLIQMIAMRYGALPIARSVGGLKDSITAGATGFLFDDYTAEALLKAIESAVGHDRASLERMVNTSMAADFSWNKSAKEYLSLYEKVLAG